MSDNISDMAAAAQTMSNTALGYLNAQEQKKANQQNYDIALKNLGLSEKQMQYMKELQEISWQRDDTAISRMVNDLKNNGFNKLLAFGTGGLSNTTVSQPSAPQMEYRYQPIDYSSLKQNLVGVVSDIENIKNIRIQRELMEKQSYGQTLNNILTELKAREDAYNFDYYSSKGLPTNATGLPKVGAEVQGIFSSNKDSIKKFVNSLIEKAKEEKEKKKQLKIENRDKKEAHSTNAKQFFNHLRGLNTTSKNSHGYSHGSGDF